MKQKTRAWIAAGLLIGGGLQTAVAESDGGRITLEERRQIQGNTPVYREVETKDLERAQLEAIARVFGVSAGDIRRFRWARLMLPPGHEDEGSVQYSIWRGGQQSRPEKVTIKIRPSGEVSSPRKRRVEEDERSNEGAGKRDRRDEITGIRQKKERPVGKSRLVAGAAPMFTVAADEFGDEDEGGADSGFGFALTGEYWLRPHLVLTGSIGYQRWNVNVDGEDEPAAFDANWSTTPVKAGIKVPFGIGPMQYFLKAESGMYRLKATAGTEELTISLKSKRKLGVSGAVGIEQMAGSTRIGLEIGYTRVRSLSFSDLIPGEEIAEEDDLERLGVSWYDILLRVQFSIL